MIAVRDEVLDLVRRQPPHQTKDHTHGR
jgi:hypothetical protein